MMTTTMESCRFNNLFLTFYCHFFTHVVFEILPAVCIFFDLSLLFYVLQDQGYNGYMLWSSNVN
jgi:hypothetical protein